MVLANPPYSIKKWNREAWQSDPWGRNFLGTPPQGRADYAFFQHILKSLDPKTGRCAILFPHGVLFRKEEAEMRRKLIESDLVECVLGLGPNLFYNSPMEACVVICRTQKPAERRGKILFIDAVDEVARERAQSFLRRRAPGAHPERPTRRSPMSRASRRSRRSRRCLRKDGNLSIPRYVKRPSAATVRGESGTSLRAGVGGVRGKRAASSGREMDALVDMLDGVVAEERRCLSRLK